MNHSNILKLKIVVVFALVFAFSSITYASEVTGNLSTSGNNTMPPPQEEPAPENNNSSVSGSVTDSPDNTSSGSSGGGSSRGAAGAMGTNGAVLGEATYNPSPSNTSSLYYPSPASGYDASSGDILAQSPPIEENAGNASLGQYEPSLIPADEGSSISSWFWIILLSILLLGILGYFYSRPANNDMMQGI